MHDDLGARPASDVIEARQRRNRGFYRYGRNERRNLRIYAHFRDCAGNGAEPGQWSLQRMVLPSRFKVSSFLPTLAHLLIGTGSGLRFSVLINERRGAVEAISLGMREEMILEN